LLGFKIAPALRKTRPPRKTESPAEAEKGYAGGTSLLSQPLDSLCGGRGTRPGGLRAKEALGLLGQEARWYRAIRALAEHCGALFFAPKGDLWDTRKPST